ncbi:MAG TPA: nucleotidyl transferase AbiEii/AbiGii toxin family protein [Ktedonobacterales bacterium]|nr:nucleotidyl transferase AbiEii/AbiGii toxin family protein [Ktedonobacterales bacterium]
MIGHYQTARAFRAALEERLKQAARAQSIDLMRLRRQVAFDRLLARLFSDSESAPPWLLKGGYAFELRLGAYARTTKDIDLAIPEPRQLGADASTSPQAQNAHIRERLQDAAERDLHDGFAFRIGAPMAELDAAPYGGARYPIEARLDNRTFATFHLDVGVGDAIATPPEWLTGQDLLGFADIPPVHVAALSREQQFAEKIHAYTLPRGEHTNTRVKDLVDLVLLLNMGLSDADAVRVALHATFTRRSTHELPFILPPPPDAWRTAYDALAAECGVTDLSMDAAVQRLDDYWATISPT